MTATGPSRPPPRRSSSSVKVRPRIAGTPDHVEERAAREEAGDDLGFPALREIEARVGERRRALQELVLPIADLLPDRVRPRAARKAHEADGLAHGQGAQDQAVHEREDRGVGADAQGQRQDRDEGEGRAAAQDADAVREVLAEVLEKTRAPSVAALLLHLLDTPELDARAAAGLGLGEAGAHVVGRLALDVVAQLGVELGLEAAAAEEPAEEAHHAPPSRVARMRPTASVSRRHSSSSTPRRVRPFPVRR